MEYNEKIVLKNGQDCIIRNATYEDGPEMSELFVLTHSESDYLRSYPEEHHFDVNAESEFLQKRAESDREVMLLAVVDGKIVATAGVSALGNKYKIRHRGVWNRCGQVVLGTWHRQKDDESLRAVCKRCRISTIRTGGCRGQPESNPDVSKYWICGIWT